jgi:hypothetical protein
MGGIGKLVAMEEGIPPGIPPSIGGIEEGVGGILACLRKREISLQLTILSTSVIQQGIKKIAMRDMMIPSPMVRRKETNSI